MDNIRAIIGLGNPGHRFDFTRHNIGFMILDELAQKYHGSWQAKDKMEVADISIADNSILLIKPQTFMNNSGEIMRSLARKGIKAKNILVVHDELEKPFGKMNFKEGGSHRGHNGLRSIIEYVGPDFLRLRFGIDRPENKSQVADYVLQRFDQSTHQVQDEIDKAIAMIEDRIK